MKERFIRVATAIPKVKVADCEYNAVEIVNCIHKALENNVQIVVFPELSITGYSCGDLFQQDTLLRASQIALKEIITNTAQEDIVAIVGMPLQADNLLFNVAVVLQAGKILGLVPKSYLPNYKEFYEKRWFSSAFESHTNAVSLCGQQVPIGNDLLFETSNGKFGIEICEDLWAPIPPSSYLTIKGAEIIFNLSASNECTGKHNYLCSLIANQSARTIAGYVYSSCGFGESSTDVVFSGNGIIYENGTLLTKTQRFSIEQQLSVADIDMAKIRHERRQNTTFSACRNQNENTDVRIIHTDTLPVFAEKTCRKIQPYPFLPDRKNAHERYEEILSIQCAALCQRMTHTKCKNVIIGISGGLDSTLALLICVKAFDHLKIDRKGILGITMPGFGTTNRTKNNAEALMKALGISSKKINIQDACLQHFKDIHHSPTQHDVVFENTQARERTQLLMDIANQANGMVIGTGDMSEMALGWATYNGDHMSMYAVNCGVPKTLIRHLVQFIAENSNEASVKTILFDIIQTPISPELLPASENDTIEQCTEDIVGAYELHDFFLFNMLRYGMSPIDILDSAEIAFAGTYERGTIKKWLKTFLNRFFSQQYKRSCMPDGPKVGSIALSPRGDWRMPSDACATIWLNELEECD